MSHSTVNLLSFGDTIFLNLKSSGHLGQFQIASERKKHTLWVDEFPSYYEKEWM